MPRKLATLIMLALAFAAGAPSAQEDAPAAQPAQESAPPFTGMDESVNVDLANKAGIPPRRPFIDVEALGELWNLILLAGGGACGFIVGRYWDQIWGRSK